MYRKEFVIGIVDHPLFGFIMAPYIVVIKPNHGFYNIEVKITPLNISKYIESFTENEKQLIKWIDEYSDQNLHKVFSKKRGQTTVDFIAKLKKDYVDEFIRPYIEKRLVKCTDLLQDMNISLYFKEKPSYIFTENPCTIIINNKLYNFDDINSKNCFRFST
jgi:hypothetical protein